jgi:hypothetical protein
MNPFPMMFFILTRKAPPLEERLRETLEKEYGISDEGTYQALLKLLKGWLKPSVQGEGISPYKGWLLYLNSQRVWRALP